MDEREAWSAAYRAQAAADLAAAVALAQAAVSASATAMLLQMSFEKLAKAGLLRQGAVSVAWARSHHASASRMVAVLRLQRRALDVLGGPWRWMAILQFIEALERAHPQTAGGGQPQLEYPWAAGVSVHWPEAHAPIADAVRSTRIAADAIKFARLLDRQFDAVFGAAELGRN